MNNRCTVRYNIENNHLFKPNKDKNNKDKLTNIPLYPKFPLSTFRAVTNSNFLR